MKEQEKLISKYDRLQAIINIATVFLGIIVVGIVFYGGIFKILNSEFPIDSFIVKKYLSCYIEKYMQYFYCSFGYVSICSYP